MSRRCGLRLENSWMNGFATGNLIETEEEKKERDARKQEKLEMGEANSIPLLNLAQLQEHLMDLDRIHEHLGFRFCLGTNEFSGASELYLVKSLSDGSAPTVLNETEVSELFKPKEQSDAESPDVTIKRLEEKLAEERRKHMETLAALGTIMDINKMIETENADLKDTVARGDATNNKLYKRIEELSGKWNDINKEFGKLTEKCAGLGLVDRSETKD